MSNQVTMAYDSAQCSPHLTADEKQTLYESGRHGFTIDLRAHTMKPKLATDADSVDLTEAMKFLRKKLEPADLAVVAHLLGASDPKDDLAADGRPVPAIPTEAQRTAFRERYPDLKVKVL